jgi:hypothetical protein
VKGNSRRSGRAYMVPRNVVIVTTGAAVLFLVASLVLVGIEHARRVNGDSLSLEVAAGLLLVVLLVLGTVPLRLRMLNRRLERELTGLQNGTVPAGESALGTLGAAFHEHFRLLRRSNQLQQGIIEVQQELIENLVARTQGKLLVLDGQGVVRYRSRGFDGIPDAPEQEGAPVHSTPPIHSVVADLLAEGETETVSVGGDKFYCYGIFGPVLLQRAADGRGLLEPREGLAYILLSDRAIDRAGVRRTGSTAPAVPRTNGLGSMIDTVFRAFRR